MGFSDKMNQIAGQVQEGIKSSSVSIFGITIKIFTALFIALTVSLIVQEMMGSGSFTFVFTMIVVGGGIFRLMKEWKVQQVLLFDLFCILVALLLRLYLQIAP